MKQKTKKILALFVLLVLSVSPAYSDQPESGRILSDPARMNSPGYAIGVAMGTTAEEAVKAGFPKSRIEYHMSLADGYLAVKYGKIDAFAFDRHVLRYVAASNPDLALMDGKIGDERIVVGAPLGSDDLVEKVNAFIEQYREDGTYRDMYDRWILGKDMKMPDLPEPENPSATLEIGTDGRTEPMSFYMDGELTGFDIEFAKRLAFFLNAEFSFQAIEFPSVIAAAATGKIDLLIASLNGTPEGRNKMLYSDPYVDSEIAFLVRKDRLAPKSEDGTADMSRFAGKRVGVMTGTIYETILKESVPDAILVYFTTFTDQIEALRSGKISGFLTDEVAAKTLIRHTSGIAYLPEWVQSQEYAFAFSKTQPRLKTQVDAALKEMRDDGTFDKLSDKWFGTDEAVKIVPDCESEGENGTIRFATNSDSVPFVYVKNGKLVGYDIEVTMTVASKLGYKLEIMDMDFSAIIPSLVSGKTQMAGAFIAVTEERAKSVLFSVPYYTGGTVMTVAAGSGHRKTDGITDVSQLARKKVGIATGSVYDQVVKRLIPEAVPEYFNNLADQTEAVKSGKIAGFLIDEPMARDVLNHTSGVTYLKPPLTSDSYAFAVAKSKPGLREQIDAALEEMFRDGTIEKIDAKWFGNDEAAKVLPNLTLEEKNGTIRLATNSGFAPFAYMKSGRMVGYDIEIAMIVASEQGYELEIVDMDPAAIIPSLISGKSDMAAGGITVTEERAQSVLFSIPNYKGGIVVMVASEPETPASSETHLVSSEADATENATKDTVWSGLVGSFDRTFVVEDRYKLILQGLWVTVLISVLSAVFGTMLGFGICLMRRAGTWWANVPAKVFIRAIQGTPIVVLLMILYYIVFGSVNINAIFVAVVGFSVNFAAYVSEMMRTGIDAVDKGQHEAALSLGFNRFQVFSKITFPQAARHVLPVFKGEFVSMLKMTSIVGYIAIQDLTKMSDIIRSRTYEAFFPLVATALIYFVIAYAMIFLLSLLEAGIDPKRRKRVVKGAVNP